MGFFSGVSKIAGALGGASGSESSGSSASGFALLPPEIQQAFTGFGTQVYDQFKDGASDDLFVPLAETADEAAAFDRIRVGQAPTEETIRQGVSMFMNPFDEFVINDINREAQGANSLVNQYATRTGQQGSNREFLSTSDVEQNRLDSIGRFRQGQFESAIDRTLGRVADLEQRDIENLLGAGTFSRNLDTLTRQAPINALRAYGGLLDALPQSGGSTSSQSSESQGESGGVGGLLKTAGTIAGFFSDERLKENVKFEGKENGHNVYSFNYKNMPDERFIGVIAQDVKEKNSDAVFVDDDTGFLKVDYDRIGVSFRKVQ